jgi:hypothetical protein
MRVVENLQAHTKRSRDILQQAKGDHLDRIHSLDGSRDDQVGEAGPVELKLKGGQESPN